MKANRSFFQCFCPGPSPMDTYWEEREQEYRSKQKAGLVSDVEGAAAAKKVTDMKAEAVNGNLAPSLVQQGSGALTEPITSPHQRAYKTAVQELNHTRVQMDALKCKLQATSVSAAQPAKASANGVTASATSTGGVPAPPTTLELQLARVCDQRAAIGSSLAAATKRLDAAGDEMQRIIATADLLGIEAPSSQPPAGSVTLEAPHLLDMPAAPLASGVWHNHSGLLAATPHVTGVINPSPMPHAANAIQPSTPLPPPTMQHMAPGLLPVSFPSSHPQTGPTGAAGAAASLVRLHPPGQAGGSWIAFDDEHGAPGMLQAQAEVAPVQASSGGATTAAAAVHQQQQQQQPATSNAGQHDNSCSATTAAPSTSLAAAAVAAAVANLGNLQSEMVQTREYIETLHAQLSELQGQEAALREQLSESASKGDELLRDKNKLAKELEAQEVIYASTVGETSSLYQDLQQARAELNATKAAVSQKDDLIEILQAQLAELFESQQAAVEFTGPPTPGPLPISSSTNGLLPLPTVHEASDHVTTSEQDASAGPAPY